MKAVRQTGTTRRSKKGAVPAGLIILALILAFFFVMYLDITYAGVRIEGIDVSGKNRQEAVKLLEAKMGP